MLLRYKLIIIITATSLFDRSLRRKPVVRIARRGRLIKKLYGIIIITI